jgi:hypothetical protein
VFHGECIEFAATKQYVCNGTPAGQQSRSVEPTIGNGRALPGKVIVVAPAAKISATQE